MRQARKDFAIRTFESSSQFPRDSIVEAIEEIVAPGCAVLKRFPGPPAPH